MTYGSLSRALNDNNKLGGKSERPSSPPHPALGFGDVSVDVVQRASDLPVISQPRSDPKGGEQDA